MPTQVNPDSPTATGAGRLQAMVGGPRDPGSPSMAGKPGVQAGRTSFPAPPAPPAAPPGRQADGARAAMGGQTTPQPGTPAPGAAPTPGAPTSAAPSPPQSPGSPQPAPGAGSQTKGTGPAAPAPPTVDANGQATQTFASTAVPKPGTVMPGTSVQTPLGTASVGPDGRQSLALDVNGQQKYKETVAKLRSKFTVPKVMKGMPGLPEMELKLGASNFDPFSGRFHGKD